MRYLIVYALGLLITGMVNIPYSCVQANHSPTMSPPLSPTDTMHVMQLIRKGIALEQKMPDSAIYYHIQGLELSKLIGFDDGIIAAMYHIASAECYRGNYEKGLSDLEATIPLFHRSQRRDLFA